jgi:hypothetical protein
MHKHNWNLIDKTVIESAFTKLLNSGRAVTSFKMGNAEVARDIVVLVFKCECGKIRIEER